MKKKLKICYVGNFSNISVSEPEIAYALEKLGHEVIRVHQSNYTLDDIKEAMKGCDLLLFPKFRVKNTTSEQIKTFLESVKIPKVCWVFDLYFGL